MGGFVLLGKGVERKLGGAFAKSWSQLALMSCRFSQGTRPKDLQLSCSL